MTPFTEIITQSKTWSCPESGTYKVICIGAGGDGVTDGKVGDMGQLDMKVLTFSKGQSVSCTISGATSFGSYMSCNKGGSTAVPMAPNGVAVCSGLYVGGCGGYSLDGSVGGTGAILAYSDSSASNMTSISPVRNGGLPGCTGKGYGAGGGFVSNGTKTSATNGSSGAIIIQRVE